jgi:transposase-like protein
MRYQVAINQNGKIMDVIVEEAKNLQEAKILAKQQNPKSKVIGVAEVFD